jgi:hypothetical protein
LVVFFAVQQKVSKDEEKHPKPLSQAGSDPVVQIEVGLKAHTKHQHHASTEHSVWAALPLCNGEAFNNTL